jgi:hypothetical protein
MVPGHSVEEEVLGRSQEVVKIGGAEARDDADGGTEQEQGAEVDESPP